VQVNYCDLCGVPMKENDYYSINIMYCQDAKANDLEGYYAALNKVQKEMKEVCPNCKTLIDQIFRLRFQNLAAISDDLLGILSLPALPPPKERKNDKEKK
jgi:hypothetical protein